MTDFGEGLMFWLLTITLSGMLLIAGVYFGHTFYPEIIEHNITINKTIPCVPVMIYNNTIKETIREVPVYKNFTTFIERNITLPDVRCHSDLNDCNYLRQKMFANYQLCLAENNSKQVSNLTFLLLDKTKQYNNCSSVIKNITKVMRK